MPVKEKFINYINNKWIIFKSTKPNGCKGFIGLENIL